MLIDIIEMMRMQQFRDGIGAMFVWRARIVTWLVSVLLGDVL